MLRKALALVGLLLALGAPVLPAAAAPIAFYNGIPGSIQDGVNSGVISPLNASPSLAPLLQYTTSVTGSAGASTCNASRCQITTESLSTAASSTYTETVTDSQATAASLIFASVTSSGTGVPVVANVTPTAGQVVLKVQNVSTGAAFNNTLVIDLFVVN